MKIQRHSLRLSALWLGLLLCFQMAVRAQQVTQPSGSSANAQLTAGGVARLSIKGQGLSSEEAETLEKVLAGDPKDLSARITLLSYYSFHQDPAAKLKKQEHALWLIKNIPDSEVLHWIVRARLDHILDSSYAEARQLWLGNLETYKGNLTVLMNAVDFFRNGDRPLAEKLLKEGAAADPKNPQWPREIGELYMMQARSATGDARRKLAATAHGYFEQAYGLARNEFEKGSTRIQLASAAFEAGQVEEARTLALEALKQRSSAYFSSSADSDSVHHAHIILGRIALRSENLEDAKQHLIEAGKVSGTPVLKSFGPSMILAKELLEKDQRETVISYLQECAVFWSNRAKLDLWTSQIKSGGMPDFGPNLVY